MKSIGLIGEPAVGKTTVMRGVIEGLDLRPHKLGKAKWMECDSEKIILMGNYNGHIFDGTDRLSMACYTDLENAVGYFSHYKKDYRMLWEGDRMTRDRWLDCLVGWELKLYHLWGEASEVAERRQNRGTGQNESWVAGRKSLCDRLSKERDAIHYRLGDYKTFASLISLLRTELGLKVLEKNNG